MAANDVLKALDSRAYIDGVPALAWSALPDGSLDFFNQRFQDYTRLSPNELYGPAWRSTVHRDDIERLETWWQGLAPPVRQKSVFAASTENIAGSRSRRRRYTMIKGTSFAGMGSAPISMAAN